MDYRQSLHDFYGMEGISVDDFRCKNKSNCVKAANNEELCCGSEAHIGEKYGEPFKIVVVSLDRGEGSESVWDRSKSIEVLDPEQANPHMAGTYKTLKAVLASSNLNGREIWKHFAMTNSAKCCYQENKGRRSVPNRIYRYCDEYSQKEVIQLQPDLIITQGKNSKIALSAIIRPIEVEKKERLISNYVGNGSSIIHDFLGNVIDDYLGYANLNDKVSVWLGTPHPSAYRGPINWSPFARFFLPILSNMVIDLMK
jgi:hypothetical protein